MDHFFQYNINTSNNYNYMTRVEEQRIRRLNRYRQNRINKLILIGLIASFIIGSIITVNAFAASNTTKDINYTKQYKSICIYCGDTLDNVAEEYYTDEYKSINQFKKEIKAINHIAEEDALIPGNYIVIPYYSYK